MPFGSRDSTPPHKAAEPKKREKTRLVAAHFDWAQSVDRLKIAQRLAEQRPAGLPDLQVCIQVNIDGGSTKSGVPPGEVLALAREVAALPRLRLRGLMTIPEPAADYAGQLAVHRKARAFGIAANRVKMRAEFCRSQQDRREDREQEEADHRIGQGAKGAIGDSLKLDWHGASEIGEARR